MKEIVRKFITYIGIIIIQILLIFIISAIFNIEAENTWLGIVGAVIMVLTMNIMFFSLARSVYKINEATGVMFFMLAYLSIFSTLIVGIMFLAVSIS